MRVEHLHLLVKRLGRRDQNLRLDLWAIVLAIEDKGATWIETSTGRKSTDKRERDFALRDNLEIVTRGHMARAREVAQENGARGGRPRKKFTPEQTARAELAWRNDKLYGDELKAAVKAQGYTLSRCSRDFGPRRGREK